MPNITKATLSRLPLYLQYIRSSVREGRTSASAIARGLGLGEVLVRKDLSLVCEAGRPKLGYQTETLSSALEDILGVHRSVPAVIVGAGKLGLALMGYDGFAEYGLEIAAAFDCDPKKVGTRYAGKTVYPMRRLAAYCQVHSVRIGVLTVPAPVAQEVCDEMIQSGITAIWNFAPCALEVPEHVTVQQENLALSLAHLRLSAIG
ncbi:MAG: redox-sensing transcriptional repressor Rex [Fretibacterium sp.]|nr:redox-sensing transcriptional repressor Rex [Fretibacterium sp.]